MNPLIDQNNPLTNPSLPMSTKDNANPLVTPNPLANPTPTPTPTPPIDINTSVKTSDLMKLTTPVQVFDPAPIIANVQKTLTAAPNAALNQQGLDGLLKLAGKKADATTQQYLGQPLTKVIQALGITSKFDTHANVTNDTVPATTTPGATGSPTPTTKAPTQAEWEAAGNSGVAPFYTPQPKTSTEILNDILAGQSAENDKENSANAVVSAKQAAANTAKAAIDALDQQNSALGAKNSLEALGLKNNFLDYQKNIEQTTGLTKTEAGEMITGKSNAINFDLSKLSIEDGKNLANYTLARIPLVQNYNIVQGDYDAAADYAKNVADAYEKSVNFQLKIMEMNNTISQQDKQALQKQADSEKENMKLGMLPLTDEQAKEAKEKIATGKTKDFIVWTDPVTKKAWLKPSVSNEKDIKATGSGSDSIDGLGIDGWVKLLSMGHATIANVPQSIRNEVVKSLSETGTSINTKLSDTEITKITDFQSGIKSLNDLQDIVSKNTQYLGPISGFQALNPWSKAKQVQADIDRVKQTVGKALEGGVLRKEDEEKYKKILATVMDTPETAAYKLDALKSSLQSSLANYINTTAAAGRYTGGVSQPNVLDTNSLRDKYQY